MFDLQNKINSCQNEVRNSRVTNLSYEIELRKKASHFELLIQTFLQNSNL